MGKGKYSRSVIVAIAIIILVVTTAYVASITLNDRLVPEEEEPVAVVTLIAINTDGLGGADEHPPLPEVWSSTGEYDLGVRVVGLRSEPGVLVKFSLTHPGISVEDVSVFYFDTISDSWRSLSLQDRGDLLVATLGPPGGIAMYEGYDFVHRLIIISNMDGACTARAWAEVS